MQTIFPKQTPTTEAEARQYAIDYQSWQSTSTQSYGEIIEWQDHFVTIAKEFDLIDEYSENGII